MSRSMRFPFVSRVFAVSAAVALGLSLSGCGGTSGNPGAAAIVNGVEISENTVTEAINDWQTLTGQAVSRVNMVVGLSEAQTYTDAARDLGVDVAEANLDAVTDTLLADMGAGVTTSELSQGGRQILRLSAVMLQAQEMGIDGQIAGLVPNAQVILNPRYGYVQGTAGTPEPIGLLGDAVASATP